MITAVRESSAGRYRSGIGIVAPRWMSPSSRSARSSPASAAARCTCSIEPSGCSRAMTTDVSELRDHQPGNPFEDAVVIGPFQQCAGVAEQAQPAVESSPSLLS